MKALTVDRSLRIRLEGRVEQLERAIAAWEEAVSSAKHGDFTKAAQMLDRGEVSAPPSSDPGLLNLAAKQNELRRELESLVQARLGMFGVPAIDLARGAEWLTTEPVRYEHHRLTLAFFRVLLPLVFFLFPLTGLTLLTGGPVAVALLAACVVPALGFVVRHYGRSDVVLTDRRMLVDGRTIELEGVKRVVFVKKLDRQWPSPVRIEFRSDRRVFEVAPIRHSPDELRNAFIRMGLEVGSDWSFF